MAWQVEVTDEFGAWFENLAEDVQDDVDRTVTLLEARGPNLPHPHSSGVKRSAFDPRRTAILLIGGDKTGDDRFYDTLVPRADRLYATYLEEIRREGLIP